MSRLTDLVQDEPVEVRHVSLIGDGTFIVIFEVLLQSHGVVWDPQDGAQVVRQHLESKGSLEFYKELEDKTKMPKSSMFTVGPF